MDGMRERREITRMRLKKTKQTIVISLLIYFLLIFNLNPSLDAAAIVTFMIPLIDTYCDTFLQHL